MSEQTTVGVFEPGFMPRHFAETVPSLCDVTGLSGCYQAGRSPIVCQEDESATFRIDTLSLQGNRLP